jgi:hypothetical protein
MRLGRVRARREKRQRVELEIRLGLPLGSLSEPCPSYPTRRTALRSRATPDAARLAPEDQDAPVKVAALDETFLTNGIGMFMDPRAATEINTQLDVLADALKPWDSGVRLTNFVDEPTDPRTFYPPETFNRLQEVKRRYDPDDLFRANHPIPSPVATGRAWRSASMRSITSRCSID